MENSEEIKRLTFSYTMEDLFVRRLFVASQTPAIKNQRSRSFFLYTLLFAMIIAFEYTKHYTSVPVKTLIGLFFVWLLSGNWLLKRYYKAHYRDTARNFDKNLINKVIELEISENRVWINENQIELTFKWEAIDRFTEINEYVFLKLKNETFIMIPKKGQDDHLPDWISALAEKNKVMYARNFGWKW